MATAAVAEQPREQTKPAGKYKPVSDLKKQYEDFLSTKDAEIREARQSRHYYHANQFTSEQLEVYKSRKQPYVTYNRTARKIDGISGLLSRMKQDPKAFARTPKHEQGAELATAAVRFVFDMARWEQLQTTTGRKAAIDGLCGVDLSIVEGKKGEKRIDFQIVDQDLFFYDPRSFQPDFSDAMYMGVAKWFDLEVAKAKFPKKAEELEGLVSARFTSELGPDHEREVKWTNVQTKKVRIADHWYRMGDDWCYTIYCSDVVLAEGKSYLIDENDESICRYLMFSCNVDHDGDRYGFVRNLKGPQDEINARRSRALWQSVSRRVFAKRGSLGDVEVARREMQRPDGVVEYDGEAPTSDDAAKQADMKAQLEFLLEAKNEIENYGPNPALIGQGVENKSGRAIALMQQAGVAELGPFIEAWKDWKLRVYRAAWAAIQRYWTGERWIRVTDDEGLAQFVQVNRMAVDPMTGMPTMVNAIGQLDVDIILDEGPDTVNMMADFYETLSQTLPPIAPMLKPAQAQALVATLIDLSPIDAAAKKRFREASQEQPNPMAQQAQQIELAGAKAKVEETQSKTMLNMAKAQEAGVPEMPAPMQPAEFQLPPDVQVAQAAAEIEDRQAAAMQKRAQAFKTEQDARLAPMDMAMQANDRAADRMTQQAIAARRQREARPNG
jgi:hypothetical protein